LPIPIDKADAAIINASGCSDRVSVRAEKLALPCDGINLMQSRANPLGDCRIRDNDLLSIDNAVARLVVSPLGITAKAATSSFQR
jgi:hypothetical protein